MTAGTDLIAAERQRQIDTEGWTPEHDDAHTGFELIRAAMAYCAAAEASSLGPEAAAATRAVIPGWWPWSQEWWNPDVDPVRNLTKAGALIAAEIDRLIRAAGETA